MPDDAADTEDLLNKYGEIIDELRPIADNGCIEPLIASFGYGDAFEGYWPVVHLLESLPTPLVRDALLRALEHGADGARMWSALMLGRQRRQEDVEALVKATGDARKFVRANAVKSLGAIGTPDAINAIRKSARDSSKCVRERVNEVLRRTD